LSACEVVAAVGLGVAAAEMAFAGNVGLTLDLGKVGPGSWPDWVALFSESPTRFLLEVDRARSAEWEDLFGQEGVPCARVGSTQEGARLVVKGRDGGERINESLADLKEAWQRPLRW
jgi:phosphoribosylformylglycinamidine synthase